MEFEKEKRELASDIYRAGEIRIFPDGTEWKAGDIKHYRIELKGLSSKPELLKNVSYAMLSAIDLDKVGCFIAIPEGGTGISCGMAMISGIPTVRPIKDLIAYRDIAKLLDREGYAEAAKYVSNLANPDSLKRYVHGSKQIVLGEIPENSLMLAIDNVASHATSFFETSELMKDYISEKKARLAGAAVVVENLPDARKKLEAAGYCLSSVFTAPELFKILYEEGMIGKAIYSLIKSDLREWDV